MLFCSIIILYRGDHVSDRKGLATTQGPALPGPGDTPRGLTRTGSPETFQGHQATLLSLSGSTCGQAQPSARGVQASLLHGCSAQSLLLPSEPQGAQVWPENSIQGQDAGTKEEHVTQAKSSSTQAGRGVTGYNIVSRIRNKLYFVTQPGNCMHHDPAVFLGVLALMSGFKVTLGLWQKNVFHEANYLTLYLFRGNGVYWPTSVIQKSTLGSQFSLSTT